MAATLVLPAPPTPSLPRTRAPAVPGFETAQLRQIVEDVEPPRQLLGQLRLDPLLAASLYAATQWRPRSTPGWVRL
jgi:hypothetical protein